MRVSAETGEKLLTKIQNGESIPIAHPDFADWLEWATGPDAEDIAEFLAPDDIQHGFREAWVAGCVWGIATAKRAYELREGK